MSIDRNKILAAGMLIGLCFSFSNGVKGQSVEAQQLLLNWEKLKQLEEILDNMYKGYKVLDKGYTMIKDISEGNFTIHQLFLDGLLAVNPAVRNYRRIPLIINYQKILLEEYQRAYARFRSDPNLTVGELEYISSVYKYLFDASVRNIDDLITVITATKLRMNDDERLKAIDRIFFELEDKLIFLRSFNNSTQLLAIQRAKSKNDVNTIRYLYNIN